MSEDSSFAAALRAAWSATGGLPGLLVASAPAIAFLVANAVAGLLAAITTAAVLAAAAFAYRLARRESLGSALAGLALAAVCAAVAGLTGDARAFFLVPTALPGVILVLCLGSVVVRRPMTGLLLNRVAGGPADWRRRRPLMRVYDAGTLVAVVVNAVNLALQTVLYTAGATAILAVAHVATGPLFAALAAGTVVAVRRRLAPLSPGGCSCASSSSEPASAA